MNTNDLKELKIGDLTARLPIIQGGMGVGISLSGLASAVANEGGIGVIAATGIGMLEADFSTNWLEANIRALRREIRKARELTKGIVGVNIMVAVSIFADLVKTAIERKLPLLAICRGIQIVNIGFRGSLIVDIPSDHGKTVIHRDKEDVFHTVIVAKDSDLFRYGKAFRFVVNSSHHQAIKTPGEGLVPVAWSEDGLIEAVELDQRFSHPFFTGVQWHPERMDALHPMSGSVGEAFLQKAEQFKRV